MDAPAVVVTIVFPEVCAGNAITASIVAAAATNSPHEIEAVLTIVTVQLSLGIILASIIRSGAIPS
jgi:molybdopterin-binding protein